MNAPPEGTAGGPGPAGNSLRRFMRFLRPSNTSRAAEIGTRVLIVGAAVLTLSSCYLLNQGSSLVRYHAAAEPIDEILQYGVYADGTALSQQTREFLSEVDRIRDYAADQGLAASSNYASLVPTDRDHLADVVNAAGELSFERYQWWWPFVGRLPYKGYYDPADAARLAERLGRRG
jgi:predicted aminopeptidase